MKVSVIGAGSWGSAVAWLLGEKGETVSLWARDQELVDGLNITRRNPRYLGDVAFAPTVTASTSLPTVLDGTEAVVLVTPSAVVGEMAERIAPQLAADTPVVLLSKGLERTTGMLLLDVLAERLASSAAASAVATSAVATSASASASAAASAEASAVAAEASAVAAAASASTSALSESSPTSSPQSPQSPQSPPILNPAEQLGPSEHFGWPEQSGPHKRLAVLSGPNHAEEVVRGTPSATVVASLSQNTADFFQALFATPAFRVYTSRDTIGIQLCGAAKNIIAIACGLAAGLGFGDNTAAMLMTRGLAEISRLASRLGADPLTCMGLAGMGDLIATCTSAHSRNRAFGLELATGGTLEAYQARTHMVVEGALACKTVTDLAQAHSVDMPISMVVRNIVWDQQPLDQAFASLIERSFKPEFYSTVTF
jgi:glycerol-3-phosphate dehydrogenase (NAD(P)+)